jgi:diacylglycerol kinase (ATP)
VKVQAILNPRAGLSAQRALGALQKERAAWGTLTTTFTERPGHALELAQHAVRAGADIVLAVGGDGTMNEVATGLLGSETALGIVPVGSGNGLGRALGIPLRPERAVRTLESAVVRRMDVGFVNGRPFLNVAGAGFDADVSVLFHEHGRAGGRRGIYPYVRLAFKCLRTYEPRRFKLMANGQQIDARALLVTFWNGRQYGAGAVIAPRARLDDGLLDVVLIEAAPWTEVLWNVPQAFTHGIERYRRYRRLQASSIVLEAETEVHHHRDGEPESTALRLDVRLEPRALKLLVPARVAADPEGPFLQQ